MPKAMSPPPSINENAKTDLKVVMQRNNVLVSLRDALKDSNLVSDLQTKAKR